MINELIQAKTKPLQARIAELEAQVTWSVARIAELEAERDRYQQMADEEADQRDKQILLRREETRAMSELTAGTLDAYRRRIAELEAIIDDATSASYVRAAVLAEREACAEIAEHEAEVNHAEGRYIAGIIRARPTP